MELSLEKQLAIIKLAKKHYSIAEKELPTIGMCYYISRALSMNNLSDNYSNIAYYIPIFDVKHIYQLAKSINYTINKPNTAIGAYWYDETNYKMRISVFNFMIKYLKLKIKENGKNSCNV